MFLTSLPEGGRKYTTSVSVNCQIQLWQRWQLQVSDSVAQQMVFSCYYNVPWNGVAFFKAFRLRKRKPQRCAFKEEYERWGTKQWTQGSYIQFHARTFVKCKCITKTNVLKSWRYFSDNWGEEIRMSDFFSFIHGNYQYFFFPSLLHLGKDIKENMKKIYRYSGIRKTVKSILSNWMNWIWSNCAS